MTVSVVLRDCRLANSRRRLKPNSLPKIRQKDGSFKEVSWDEAFTHVASELNRIPGGVWNGKRSRYQYRTARRWKKLRFSDM